MNPIFITMITLAIVQGIAEFLPISSSGHLVIFENIGFFKDSIKSMGEDLELFINVALHVSSLAAVCVFLRKDIMRILKGTFAGLKEKNFKNEEIRTALYILIASIPAGVIGAAFHDFFESLFSTMTIVFFMLIFNGFILLSTKIITVKDRKLEETGLLRSIFVGFFQAIAIIPGISRAGSTITGGMLTGLAPEESAKFSFLMAIPVIAGAGLLESLKLAGRGLPEGAILPLASAMIITALVALLALKILFAMVRKIRIDVFGYYTILLGTAGIIYIYFIK